MNKVPSEVRVMARELGMRNIRPVLVDGVVYGYTGEHSGLFTGLDTDGNRVTSPYLNRGMATIGVKKNGAPSKPVESEFRKDLSSLLRLS